MGCIIIIISGVGFLCVKNQQEVPCEEGFATSNAFGDVQ
jgi:hypothetical protein